MLVIRKAVGVNLQICIAYLLQLIHGTRSSLLILVTTFGSIRFVWSNS